MGGRDGHGSGQREKLAAPMAIQVLDGSSDCPALDQDGRPFNRCNDQLLDLDHPLRAPPWAGVSMDEASQKETTAEAVCTPSSSRGGFCIGTGGWC